METGSAALTVRRSQGWWNSLISLAAFGAACLAIHYLMPVEEDPLVQSKMKFYEKHHGEFDALFIGSSRMYRQISPKIFDATLAAGGIEFSSFNFGFPAVVPPETFYLLREILERKSPRLKWAFIELSNFRTEIPPKWLKTQRELAWHEWRETWLEARFIWKAESKKKGIARLSRFVEVFSPHLQLFANNMSNVGQGQKIMLRSFPKKQAGRRRRTKPKVEKDEPLSSSHGFIGLKETNITGSGIRGYEMSVEKLMGKEEKRRKSDAVFREALNRAEDECRRAGVTPIFVIPPTLFKVNKHVLTDDPQRAHILFTYDDPRKHPKLYELSSRHDMEHLNVDGANEFTRVFAEDFAQWLSAHPPVPR